MPNTIIRRDYGVKISQKISFEDFIDVIRDEPKKISISSSILEQSKNISQLIELLRHLSRSQRLPEIEIIRRGKKPETIKQDWLEPYIRDLVGKAPSVESQVRMKLLDADATAPKKGVNMNEFDHDEFRIINRLRKREHIDVTDDFKVYLTDLGCTLAKGAKKLYS